MKKRLCLVLALIVLTAGTAAAQKPFYNKEFKFGFKYPARSVLEKQDPDAIAASPNFKSLARITLTHPGKGLFDGTAAVSAANITSDACRALSTQEGDKPLKKRFGTVTFTKTTEIEGGMESVHPAEFYRTFRNGTCYEVFLMVGMEKYPKHRVSDRPAFEQLYTILRTFYFRYK
jgi:hypothetical protein